jgi:hypothetical protein
LETIAEIQAMSDEQVQAKFDALTKDTQPGVSFWLGEIERRDTKRATDTMKRLTWAIAVMTGVMVAAALFTGYCTWVLVNRP